MSRKKLVNDPWAHRSTEMRCDTCMFAVAKVKSTLPDEKGNITCTPSMIGRCRRHAPTMSGYPVIYMSVDWCGDHKLDETKVN